MKVTLSFTSEKEQVVPQARTSIPTNRMGHCWRISVRLGIGGHRKMSYSYTGHSLREEDVAGDSVREAIKSCPIITGPIELDLTQVNGELSATEKQKLMQEFK